MELRSLKDVFTDQLPIPTARSLDMTLRERCSGETLSEEADADKQLTKIATGGLLRKGINDKAAA